MRKACLDCAIKHLAQAQILMDESRLGYPLHKHLAIGHLAEAESEMLGVSVEKAANLRAARLAVAAGEKLPYEDMLAMLLGSEKPDPRDYMSKAFMEKTKP